MKHRLLMAAIVLLAVLVPLQIQPTPAYADCPDAHTSKGQVLQGIGATGSDCDSAGVTGIFSKVVDVLTIVVGALAIIMIILSGYKYITSAGDAGKVASAKSTLIYALVGIAVVVLAHVIVTFTASSAEKSTLCSDGNPGHNHLAASDPHCGH